MLKLVLCPEEIITVSTPEYNIISFQKKSEKIVSHGPHIGSNIYFDERFNRTDNENISWIWPGISKQGVL